MVQFPVRLQGGCSGYATRRLVSVSGQGAERHQTKLLVTRPAFLSPFFARQRIMELSPVGKQGKSTIHVAFDYSLKNLRAAVSVSCRVDVRVIDFTCAYVFLPQEPRFYPQTPKGKRLKSRGRSPVVTV